MTALLAILSRWRAGLIGAALLAFIGLGAAALHYRGALRTERAGRAADRASYIAAQAEATRLSAEAIHHQEAVYQMKAAQQDTAHETELARLALLALPMLMLTACVAKPLVVHPATPPPAPRVAIPDFAKACPPLVSWYPTRTCKPVPQ
jgi:hypothetical protein